MHFQVAMLENCKKYIFGEKETRKNVPHIFFHVKFLGKGSNIIIGLFTQKSKVQCMYLTLKNLKIRRKKVQQWSES